MQYSSDKKSKNSTVYIVIALCLIAIFASSYVAVTKKDKAKTKNESGKETSSETNRIESNEPSYNGITESSNTSSLVSEVPEIVSAPTENPVSDVPYTETENTESKTDIPPVPQGFVLPVKGNIIKNYSDESLQYDKTLKDMRLHQAIDVSCEENAKIVSATNGTVLNIEDTPDFGTVITIDHGNGLTVKYCGLGSVCVTKGEEVGAGVLLGTSKNPPCESSDENHIHIECYKDGVSFSPLVAFGF